MVRFILLSVLVPILIFAQPQGRILWSRHGTDGSPLWYYNFNERVYDVTGAPDLNGDGNADVVVGLQDQGHEPDHLFCFSGLPLSAIDANPAYLPKNSPSLLTFDPLNRTILIQTPAGSSYRLRLFDASGRIVIPAVTGKNPDCRPAQVALDSHGFLPAGTYFANLVLSDGYSSTLKLVLPTKNKL